MKKTTMIPAGILAALLGGACEGESGVSRLRWHAMSVAADNAPEDLVLGRALSFSLRPTALEPRHSDCATVKDATVRFNGQPVRALTPGGPDGHIFGGCDFPFIRVPVDAGATTPADAMLEIEDDGGRVVVSLPGLYVRRQLEIVSVSREKAILRSAPSFDASKVRAWVPGLFSSRPDLLETIVAGNEIHVILTGVLGPRTLHVEVDLPAPAIARCEGVVECEAKASMRRQFMIEVH